LTVVDDRLSTLLFAAEQAVDIAVEALLRGRVHVKALIDTTAARLRPDIAVHAGQHRPYGTRSCR
jgi:hypothetical protein